ncbi:hypothetical protein QQF64_033873 [Cirrhinus molitorella]|uniref:Transposase element L1Md-A101/L1Md-A102/L1Md-A2 n=1 Tax=Cirrhinus molitorella TaxID=172907 RepID=A0ABR3MVE5_9TELE
MANKLRKYKYSGPASARPEASLTQPFSASSDSPPISQLESGMGTEDWKADILASLREDISAVIKGELKNALSEDFNFLKNELKEVKSEIANNTAAIRSEVDNMKTAIRDVEEGLSTWLDEMTSLQAAVAQLKTEMAILKEKNDDLEGRMRRCNVRIAGVPEETGSSSTAAVSKLLKDVLKLEKDILIDRSHREVLRRARGTRPLQYQGEPISIFPDYTANVARARNAFNGGRNLLRGRVRYGIMFPARLRISYKGDSKEFLDPEKAMAYVKSTIPETNT